MDKSNFPLPDMISWPMLRQWLKTIHSKTLALKTCMLTMKEFMDHNFKDIDHPVNFDSHNTATAEYTAQIRKVQIEIDKALKLSRGFYFDEVRIKLKTSNRTFICLTPDGNMDRPNAELSCAATRTETRANAPQSSRE